jgi:hypothetical protein
VLDLKERRIVTTARCECLGGEIIGSPSYWHYAEDSQGNPRFTIWTFRLARWLIRARISVLRDESLEA